jgi:geranylgeranyl reductase
MLHVVVVGGGPAGLVAAETLAAAGIRTTVVESHPDRLLPCAGLLTSPALAALGMPELLLAQRINELAVFSPTNRVAFVTLGGLDRYAGVIRRELIQTLLRRRAVEAGATMLHGSFRRFVHSAGDYPMLEIKRPDGTREQLQADVVIGADGVHSRVARALGLAPLELGVAYLEKLALPAGPGGTAPKAPEGMQIHFGRKVSTDRYGWMAPHLDHLVLGVATHRRYGKRVWDMLGDLKKRLGSQLDGAKPAGREAFLFPLGRRPRLAHDRVLLVGDAAGVGPAATFDGLYYAAMSGRAAAETVIAHRNMPVPEALAAFDARFLADHGAALAGAEKLERLFFQNEKRREALVDLAWDRRIQRVALDAFLDKKALAPTFKVAMALKTRLATALVKYSLASPKRPENDQLSRALPQGENYLDLALKSGGGLTTLPPLRDVLGGELPPDEPAVGVGRDDG